jgi:hypothetical protein
LGLPQSHGIIDYGLIASEMLQPPKAMAGWLFPVVALWVKNQIERWTCKIAG